MIRSPLTYLFITYLGLGGCGDEERGSNADNIGECVRQFPVRNQMKI